MIATQQRSFFDAVVREPLSLAKAQPHQILLSTGSIALMGQFAGSSGILDPYVGYCIAAGVEWAYLRGLASDSRAPTVWGAILNWSAFGIVVLWGILWVASVAGSIDPHAAGFWGWALAGAHVVPIAWLSLCSAQAHRAAMIAERADMQRREDERAEAERAAAEEQRLFELEQARQRAAWELAQAEEDRKLARWKDAYAHKQAVRPAPKNASQKSGTVPEAKATTAFCKLGNHEVAWSTPSEAGTIKRWGCAECRRKKEAS